ncbi:type II secretion system minor pseudopilin GspJ [Vibrio sp. ZSDE26]|uniref:Type II secretion system protein J n=1 Tax=Vibrio amylolyticus TaxID=2847292 RepID=A0A9X2BGV0_9VIBR|nr:type II secretion system minor pseudopilin GspJ [Vibrio amylolyticus]MCK6263314.1 type II secretion system minor pseudopilin GspJ [Vibrio amylolyticus]
MWLSKTMLLSKVMSLINDRLLNKKRLSQGQQLLDHGNPKAHKAVKNARMKSGFTLLEVLVAMAIFAALSVSAYQVVDQVRLSNAMSLERGERLKELQRSMVMMDSDFRQIATRQFRTNGEQANGEEGVQLLQWQDYLLESDSKGVLFTRLGWHNPQQQFPRGEIVKVGYRIKDDTLERVWWRYPDTPVGQQAVVTPLLHDVESFNLRFYYQGSWVEEWSIEQALPEAISVELELTDYGKITRVYLVASGAIVQGSGNQSGDNQGGNNSEDPDDEQT